MEFNFRNFAIPITEETILIYLILLGISYYLFFGKHHKRNEMKFSEIYPLVINYLGISIISTIVFLIGLDIVFTGYIYNDEIIEVIKELTLGLAIISLVILNFIFYIKRHQIDFVQSEREAQNEKNNRIGEWIQILIFSLLILCSVFNIFKYANFIDELQRTRQIIGSLICIIISMFLLYNLNPLDIKNKIKKLFNKKDKTV